jgi:hypothetical protein
VLDYILLLYSIIKSKRNGDALHKNYRQLYPSAGDNFSDVAERRAAYTQETNVPLRKETILKVGLSYIRIQVPLFCGKVNGYWRVGRDKGIWP